MGNWTDTTPRIAIIGAGRLGTALAAALQAAGLTVSGPHGRGFDGAGADAVLLCVPDAQIAGRRRRRPPRHARRPLLRRDGPRRARAVTRAFGLHPLMTVTPEGAEFARRRVRDRRHQRPRASRSPGTSRCALGMTPFAVADEDRAAYHAAASVASNLLVALEGAAERLAATAGVPREALAPLVRASAENWARRRRADAR